MSKRQPKRPLISVEEGAKSAHKKRRSTENSSVSSTSSAVSPTPASTPASTPAIVLATPTVALTTPPRRQRSLTEFESSETQQLNQLLRLQAAPQASGITFDSTKDLKNWLQTNSTPGNHAATPWFNFQGVVVGFSSDFHNNRNFKRLYLWGGAATENEVDQFVAVFNQLHLGDHRATCQSMVLTLTVWKGLEEGTFNNGERITVKNIKGGSLYKESPQGSVSDVTNSITRD